MNSRLSYPCPTASSRDQPKIRSASLLQAVTMPSSLICRNASSDVSTMPRAANPADANQPQLLAAKLGPEHGRRICTVRNVGYRFEA